MELEDVFLAVLCAAVLLLLGKWVRGRVGVLQRLFLPSSIIAGVLALVVGPQVLGRFFDGDSALAGGAWPEPVLDVWTSLPGILINLVFAALFLGKSIPAPRTIWHKAGPMVAHGQTLAWGQYVVGLSLVLLLLSPVWGVNPMAGALIEIGFEGGHGTAAGLSGTFRELGFEDGADLALGLATIGVVMGVFPRDWATNGLANFGQGIGMTVIGLLLVRMSDPRNRSGAMEAFGYKQLLFEPVVGGGLFTAASLPLIYEFDPRSIFPA